jgi:glycosyltransferase involved in cell wall biosynthesis
LNILFFQYGDFGNAYKRLEKGEPETYRDQRLAVEFVASLRSNYHVTTIAICERSHDELLDRGLRSIGVGKDRAYQGDSISSLFELVEPDLIICRTPHLVATGWARRHRVRTLLSLADYFSNRNVKQFLRNLRFRMLLDTSIFPCVANHNLGASISVSNALLYPSSRIVPWDWSRLTPAGVAKTKVKDSGRPTVFFAGALTASKGVGDCLNAVGILQRQGLNLRFVFAGDGDTKLWRAVALQLGIEENVQFLGIISNSEVRRQMRDSDIVVVSSRHNYPEGLPNVIYEALASRTPLVVSDHPAFVGRLRSNRDCVVFPAGNSAGLAKCISELISNKELFSLVSANSLSAHENLYLGMEWTQLVSTFIADPNNNTHWVESNSLQRFEDNRDAPSFG